MITIFQQRNANTMTTIVNISITMNAKDVSMGSS